MLNFNQQKEWIILGILAAFAMVGIFYFAHFYKTGKWVCRDGIWVAQGTPPDPKPGLYCK
jgi:hypothetical protein